MFLLRDLPKHEVIQSVAARYTKVDPVALEAFLYLLRVSSDVLSRAEAFMGARGLSQGRFTVLMLLNRDPTAAVCPSTLADQAGVTRATMTGLIDGLEREGLVSREDDLLDRRMVRVQLTETGQERLRSMLPAYFELIARMMHHLTSSDQQTLIDLVKKIDASGEHAPCAAPQ